MRTRVLIGVAFITTLSVATGIALLRGRAGTVRSLHSQAAPFGTSPAATSEGYGWFGKSGGRSSLEEPSPSSRPCGELIDVPVLWSAPLFGGVLRGIAEEAGNLLIPLVPCIPRLMHIGLMSANFQRNLASNADRAALRKIHVSDDEFVDSDVEGRPIYITQWDPNQYSRHAGAAWTRLRYRIGRAMYETTGLPPGWGDAMRKMDEIWVPSQWTRDMFSKLGIARERIHVVPESLDAESLDPARVPRNRSLVLRPGTELDFVFLSIFKWESRKNVETLLEAFLVEFADDASVSLHLLTTPPQGALEALLDKLLRGTSVEDHGNGRNGANDRAAFPGKAGRAGRARAADSETGDADSRRGNDTDAKAGNTGPAATKERKGMRSARERVYRVAKVQNEYMPVLYRSADAFVLPTHGEGWGRPLFEAMAMGVPTIAPYWSGQTEYLRNDTAYLIPVTELESAQHSDNFGDTSGHQWAHIDVGVLRRIMRRVYDDSQGPDGGPAAEVGRRATADVRSRFSREAIGRIITARLAVIARDVP